jgi:hypothetical protein
VWFGSPGVLSLVNYSTLGQDDVAAALAGAGVSGASFTGVQTEITIYDPGKPSTTSQTLLDWSFSLVAPAAKLNSVVAQLVAVQTAMSKQKPPLSLSYFASTLQVSPQSTPVCLDNDLVADARGFAQMAAAAAGVSAGPIVSLVAGASSSTIPTAAFLLSSGSVIFDPYPGNVYPGNFIPLLRVAPYSPPIAPACSLSVQFQLN